LDKPAGVVFTLGLKKSARRPTAGNFVERLVSFFTPAVPLRDSAINTPCRRYVQFIMRSMMTTIRT
jgi:hypothetical protein